MRPPLQLRPTLGSIFAGIGQRIEATAGKNFMELVQERVVHEAVGGERLAAVDLKRRAIETGHFAAGFFDDEHARGRIPGIEIELPKSLEAAARHAAQVERSRSGTP